MAAGLAAGLLPEAVFVAGEATDVAARLAESGSLLADAPVYPVDARVAARLSTLETPASIMAIFAIPPAPALGELCFPPGAGAPGRTSAGSGEPERTSAGSGEPSSAPVLVVYADGIADPGNLGTLVRAAAAFAAAALIAAPGSVDLFSPKVVRAGMGAVFDLPLYQDVPLAQAVAELGARAVYGLVAHGGAPLDGVAPLDRAASLDAPRLSACRAADRVASPDRTASREARCCSWWAPSAPV